MTYVPKGTLAQIFSKVNPNALLKYFMDDFRLSSGGINTLALESGYKPQRFLCQREMVRDLDRELVLHDGFAYWRTTGRLLVTWYDGSVTVIETKEIAHNPVVIDCGYDESLPF